MARMAIAPEDRPRVKAECLRVLATLRLEVRRARLISRFVDAYLNLNAEENREFQRELSKIDSSGTKRDKIMAYVTTWERSGIKTGIQRTVRRQLRSKLGRLNRSLEKRVNALSNSRQEELAVALLNFSSVADLDAWLNRR